ncbi:MAG: colicin V production protein [Flavobacterium sp.]|nr:MAG: colicin V production protein [Flavobacterium sp.]
MNIFDIVLGIILVFAFIRGMKKGLFVTLASLIGLVLGVIAAIYFSEYAAEYIYNWFNWSEQTSNIVARVVTFIAVVVVINWAGKFLTKLADFAFLGIFNKLLGGVFNVLIIAFIISVVFMFFNQWNTSSYIISEEKTKDSILYEPMIALAPMVLPDLKETVEDIEFPEELIDQVKEKTEDKINEKIDSLQLN